MGRKESNQTNKQMKKKREMVVLLLLSYGYLVTVNVQWLFLLMQWVGPEFMIVVFPDHTHSLPGLVTKMPPCPNKVKTILNLLWNKTKMPPIPYMVLTDKGKLMREQDQSLLSHVNQMRVQLYKRPRALVVPVPIIHVYL